MYFTAPSIWALALHVLSIVNFALGKSEFQIAAIHDTPRDLTTDSEGDLITKRCFEECVERQLSATECKEYIEEALGENLENHEIPDLQIKINRPRSKEVFAATYWMIAIPTTIYGETDCEINNAVISYKFLWETSKGNFGIPDVDCLGLGGDECCNKVLKTVEEQDIPLVDKNGNCLSCWVHQEPLEPIRTSGGGGLAYLEFTASAEGTCSSTQLSVSAVRQADDDVETKLAALSGRIKTMLQSGTTCDDLSALQQELFLYARAFPRAMSRISKLLCGYCPGDLSTIPQQLRRWLYFISVEITKEIKSDENCLIIYTDHQGKVMEPPKIGGSRADLDYDRDDPGCDELDGGEPVVVPVGAPIAATTSAPTKVPSKSPSIAPVVAATGSPTKAPTVAPVVAATSSPTKAPSEAPTKSPTQSPTVVPVVAATSSPTKAPTVAPVVADTSSPTKAPSEAPTQSPTVVPVAADTSSPTKAPSKSPTKSPTQSPTVAPVVAATDSPTKAPTAAPVVIKNYPPTEPPVPKSIFPRGNDCPLPLLFDPQTGTCVCPSNQIVDPRNGIGCVCPGSSFLDSSNPQLCVCSGDLELTGNGECSCPGSLYLSGDLKTCFEKCNNGEELLKSDDGKAYYCRTKTTKETCTLDVVPDLGNQACDDCRLCIEENCGGDWDSNCRGLVEGKQTGSPEKWRSCLTLGGLGNPKARYLRRQGRTLKKKDTKEASAKSAKSASVKAVKEATAKSAKSSSKSETKKSAKSAGKTDEKKEKYTATKDIIPGPPSKGGCRSSCINRCFSNWPVANNAPTASPGGPTGGKKPNEKSSRSTKSSSGKKSSGSTKKRSGKGKSSSGKKSSGSKSKSSSSGAKMDTKAITGKSSGKSGNNGKMVPSSGNTSTTPDKGSGTGKVDTKKAKSDKTTTKKKL